MGCETAIKVRLGEVETIEVCKIERRVVGPTSEKNVLFSKKAVLTCFVMIPRFWIVLI
jgi:hypothetical protein